DIRCADHRRERETQSQAFERAPCGRGAHTARPDGARETSRHDRALACHAGNRGEPQLSGFCRASWVLLALALAVATAPAATKHPLQASHPAKHSAPSPQPPALEQIPDLSHAVPAKELGRLPSTEDQYHALNSEIGRERPGVENAKAKSEALRAEADALR